MPKDRRSREMELMFKLMQRRAELKAILSEENYRIHIDKAKQTIRSYQEIQQKPNILSAAMDLAKQVLRKYPDGARITANVFLAAGLEMIEEGE